MQKPAISNLGERREKIMNKLNSAADKLSTADKNIRDYDKKECIYKMKLMKCLCAVGLIWTGKDNNSF